MPSYIIESPTQQWPRTTWKTSGRQQRVYFLWILIQYIVLLFYVILIDTLCYTKMSYTHYINECIECISYVIITYLHYSCTQQSFADTFSQTSFKSSSNTKQCFLFSFYKLALLLGQTTLKIECATALFGDVLLGDFILFLHVAGGIPRMLLCQPL